MESHKKRHRRTKAELLMDPVYCAKHGIKTARLQKAEPESPNKPEKGVSAPKRAEKKAPKATKSTLTRDQKIAMAERKHLPKVYKAWEEVQRRLTDMERDVMEFVRKFDPVPREFLDLDTEAGRMEDAFARFESEVDKRAGEG